MLNQILIHNIKAIRYASIQNSIGEFVTSTSSIVPTTNYIPARVESWNRDIRYKKSGEEIYADYLIYIPATYTILVDDEIYFGTLTDGSAAQSYIGRVVGVERALKGNTNMLDHYELVIQVP